MSAVVEKLKAALELKELHDLKLQREHEQEEILKATGSDYGEIFKLADRPLIYKSAMTKKTLEVLKRNYGPEVDLVYSKYAIRFPELVENGSSSRRSQPDNGLLRVGDTSLR
nr:protein kinase-like domain, phloem protein 2-like protein [Tanacetum cinerariifolium]